MVIVTKREKENSSVSQKALEEDMNKFLPPSHICVLEDGRVPLRVQIYNEKEALRSILTKPKKGVYMCSHCTSSFTSFGELLDHFDKFNIQRPYKCSQNGCPWNIVGFNKARQLYRHERTVHTNQKSHICSIEGCGSAFVRRDLLKRHMKSVHQNEKSRFNQRRRYQKESLTNVKQLPSIMPQKLIKPDLKYTNASSSDGLSFINARALSPLPQKIVDKRRSHYKHSIDFVTNHD